MAEPAVLTKEMDEADYRDIGFAFMAKLPADYSWSQCPTEYVTELENRLADAAIASGSVVCLPADEVRGLRLDAERYRWLRQWTGDKAKDSPDLGEPTSPEDADRIVDAARQEPGT